MDAAFTLNERDQNPKVNIAVLERTMQEHFAVNRFMTCQALCFANIGISPTQLIRLATMANLGKSTVNSILRPILSILICSFVLTIPLTSGAENHEASDRSK